jgi:hypothetical protein
VRPMLPPAPTSFIVVSVLNMPSTGGAKLMVLAPPH